MCPFVDGGSVFLEKILPTVFGGLIAGLVGIWVGNWQRRRDARNTFLVSISLIKAAIPAEDMFDDFHTRSTHEAKEAVYRVLPFLAKSRADRLVDAPRRYCALESEQLQEQYEVDAYRMAMEFDKLPVPPKPSTLLKNALDDMAKIVK